MTYTYTLDKDIKIRLDKFLPTVFNEITRSTFSNLIDSGILLVNGKKVQGSYKPRKNDIISFEYAEKENGEVLPEKIDLDIIYEDDDFLIINKPKGMVTHPAPGNMEHTLVNALLGLNIPLSQFNEDPLRPGIVHRLDKDTTGLLVVAKNNEAHKNLEEQIRTKTAFRIYTLLCFGNIKNDRGVIDKPIGRNPNDRKKMGIVAGGRNAVTEYEVLDRFKGYTLVRAKLQTGRTHQIRVHFTDMGYPLVGDDTYTKRKSPYETNGQMLHAGRLEINHPRTGERLIFEAPLPEYFRNIIVKLEKSR